ncbi:Peptidase inhibitor I78 family protein [Palleronia salina]|uniref:Peptidase inhibitor I78 family protein n=1 Tax=Palleronia salina TaxID=313368 RepID=A0A1M6DGW9_9RHOB|nr:I78 family peptidase inhibitor [Palleronia salina]SHI72279.1 Peptidase inhibitor I78 family protein [Palleronia salina]
MRAPALALALPILAACQASAPSAPAPGASAVDPSVCGADGLQGFVGGPVGPAQQAAGQSITRVYAQGDPVTMDMLPERINIVTDGQGTVLAITCG